MDVEAMDAIELEVGEFVEFPDTTAYILMEETWPQRYYCTVFAIPECTVDPDSDGEVELSADDEEIDIIKSVKGVKAGNVILALTVTMGDKSKTVPLNITVKPIALENAVITLDKESYAYTGKEVIPEVTVELNGNILTSDDYEVEYRDNTGTEDEDSTGTVVITGKGNYTGTVQTTFQIVVYKHEHEENVVREATCTEAREKSLTCTKCGDTKTEVIPATGHTEVIDAKVDPTCTEPGLTDGKKCSVCGETLVNQTSIAATGHSYGEWEVVKEATWDEDGEEKHVCSICNAEETRTINRGSYGHQDDFTVEGEVIKAPTCTEAGS